MLLQAAPETLPEVAAQAGTRQEPCPPGNDGAAEVSASSGQARARGQPVAGGGRLPSLPRAAPGSELDARGSSPSCGRCGRTGPRASARGHGSKCPRRCPSPANRRVEVVLRPGPPAGAAGQGAGHAPSARLLLPSTAGRGHTPDPGVTHRVLGCTPGPPLLRQGSAVVLGAGRAQAAPWGRSRVWGHRGCQEPRGRCHPHSCTPVSRKQESGVLRSVLSGEGGGGEETHEGLLSPAPTRAPVHMLTRCMWLFYWRTPSGVPHLPPHDCH